MEKSKGFLVFFRDKKTNNLQEISFLTQEDDMKKLAIIAEEEYPEKSIEIYSIDNFQKGLKDTLYFRVYSKIEMVKKEKKTLC